MTSTKTISVEQLYNLLPSMAADNIVLDVRSKGEFAAGHIQGVTNVSLSKFADYIAEHKAELQHYQTIYVMCWSGGRSEVAVAQLQAAGIPNAINVDGGLQAWLAAKYPIVTPTGAA